jgi:hypothetical protein
VRGPDQGFGAPTDAAGHVVTHGSRRPLDDASFTLQRLERHFPSQTSNAPSVLVRQLKQARLLVAAQAQNRLDVAGVDVSKALNSGK